MKLEIEVERTDTDPMKGDDDFNEIVEIKFTTKNGVYAYEYALQLLDIVLEQQYPNCDYDYDNRYEHPEGDAVPIFIGIDKGVKIEVGIIYWD